MTAGHAMALHDEPCGPANDEIVAADVQGEPAARRPNDLVVVKLGGSTIAEQAHVLDQLVVVAAERPVVVVHGGGRRVSDWLGRLGVPTRFEDGLRVTDAQAMEVAAAVLRGAVSTELVAALRARGADAVGLSGVDGGLLAGRRVAGWGLVARVMGVRRGLLDAVLAAGSIPVVAPLALDEAGEVCNVNADDAAAGLARGLGARLLVLLTDVEGVRDRAGTAIASLSVDEAEVLIADGVIEGGMIPKVRAAMHAVGAREASDARDGGSDAGPACAEAVIADGSAPDALARAIHDPAFGTRIGGNRTPCP